MEIKKQIKQEINLGSYFDYEYEPNKFIQKPINHAVVQNLNIFLDDPRFDQISKYIKQYDVDYNGVVNIEIHFDYYCIDLGICSKLSGFYISKYDGSLVYISDEYYGFDKIYDKILQYNL